MIEVPGDDAIEFALSILAAFDDSPSHVGGSVSIQPLLAEHREKGGEEGSSEACIKDGLDLDDWMRWAGPLGNGGSVVTKGGVVNLVDEDSEEGSSLLACVRPELGLDINDEGRSNSRE